MSCPGHIQYYGVQVNPAGSLHCKYQKKSILQINWFKSVYRGVFFSILWKQT